MSFRTLELPTVTIEKVCRNDDCLTLKFHGEIIKTMEGADQRTRWQQSGSLIMHAVQIQSEPTLTLPVVLTGGDLIDNIYVYRNIIRLPLHSFGNVGFRLQLKNSTTDFAADGSEIEVVLDGEPKYICHLD